MFTFVFPITAAITEKFMWFRAAETMLIEKVRYVQSLGSQKFYVSKEDVQEAYI